MKAESSLASVIAGALDHIRQSCETGWVVTDKQILARNRRVVVEHREEIFIGEHANGHIVAEHFNLLPDVTEESIARPPPANDDHIAHVHGDMGKVHGHARSGPNGMCVNVFSLDAQFVFTNHNSSDMEVDLEVIDGKEAELLGDRVMHGIN
eukprot:scaffold91726_cov59-Attheya_sp.AAC.2